MDKKWKIILKRHSKKFHNLNEFGRRSMRKVRNKAALSLRHLVSKGRLKNYRSLRSNPCFVCQWNEKEEREGRIKKKKTRRKEGQTLTEKGGGQEEEESQVAEEEKPKQGEM